MLKILDVSALVHTGASAFGDRQFYGYPVGGIHYLMRYVSTALLYRDDLALCFDSPSFRLQLQGNYKSGRVHNAPVISQIETLYENLSACGIKCLKYDGYEADDIIYWISSAYCKVYDEIEIIGNDHDLCHSVRNGVSFKACRSGMNNVNCGNFETAIIQCVKIPFNTISAYKVFCGCPSDSIPAMSMLNGMSSAKVYAEYLKFLEENDVMHPYEYVTSKSLPTYFAEKSGLFTESEIKEVEKRVELVYPANKPDNIDLTKAVTSVFDVDVNAIAHFLALYGDKDSLACFDTKPKITEYDKQIVRDKVKLLSSGSFAVDHSIEDVPRVDSSVLRLDSFSRDF